MRTNIYYQYCLSEANSYWAIPIDEMLPYQDENRLSYDFYLFSKGIHRLSLKSELFYHYEFIAKERFNLIQKRYKYNKTQTTKNLKKSAIKIASATPLNIIQIVISKLSIALMPVLVSVGMIFSPLILVSPANHAPSVRIEQLAESFRISEGFLEQTNSIGDEMVKEQNNISDRNKEHFIEAPKNLEIYALPRPSKN